MTFDMPTEAAAGPSPTVTQLLNRFQDRTAKIGIIGLGYVGLPLSLLLSEAGFRVTGFDIDERKITDLESGRSYILRIAAEEICCGPRPGLPCD